MFVVIQNVDNMKTHNKYYTPELEEFHVGFEYEYFTKDWVGKDYTHTWVKLKFNQKEDYGNDLDNMVYFIETEQVRVKYLDREDIESLGFDLDQCTKDGCVFIKGI